MFILYEEKRILRVNKTVIFSKPTKIVLVFALSLSYFNLHANQTSTNEKDDEMEHITVTGEDQLSVLRYNVYRAEEEFFNSFNDLLTNKDFKIACKNEKKHAFTRLKKRKCKSAFESDMSFEVTQTALRSGRGGIKNSPLKSEIHIEQQKLRKKQIAEMERLIKESPELQAKLIKLNQAKVKFESAKQTKEAE